MNQNPLRRFAAFTLTEMLVVMGIIVLMGALIVPAVSGTLKGTALSQASQTLIAQLNNAQQTALAKGQSIQVRLYLMGDTEAATADQETQNTWKVRGIQLFTQQPNLDTSTVKDRPVVYTPFSKMELFPNAIIIDQGTGNSGNSLTTLCDMNNTTMYMPKGSADYLMPKLPRVGTNYAYFYFQFRPDGSTTLDATKQWYATLHTLVSGDKLTAPPSNFFTVSIDPVQGSTRVFRPQ